MGSKWFQRGRNGFKGVKIVFLIAIEFKEINHERIESTYKREGEGKGLTSFS